LVVKDRLVQHAALLHQSRLRICHFHDRRFARPVTRDRRAEIVLCFRHTFTREIDSPRRVIHLRTRRVELLCKSPQRECSFVLRNVDAQLSLSLTAATRTPIKDRNRKTDRRRHAGVLLQPRCLQRIGIKAAVDRIPERRQAISTRDPDLLSRGAQLLLQLSELRTTRNVFSFELLKFRSDRKCYSQIRRSDWSR